MKLYSYWRSSCSWRVRIALNLKGIPHEIVPIHLVRNEQEGADHRARSPMGQVPVLETEQGTLSQSLAILEYLEEVHPTPALLPADPWRRAQVRAVAEAVNSGIQPIQNIAVTRYVTATFGGEAAARAVAKQSEPAKEAASAAERRGNPTDSLPVSVAEAWNHHWITRGLVRLEAMAQSLRGAGPFFVGESTTYADVCLVPQLYNARRFGCPVETWPTLLAIEAACEALPAFQAAHPDRQPDAEVINAVN